MDISKPVIKIQDGKIEYRVSVKSTNGVQDLWYSFDKKYADLLSNLSDAALAALLIPAMVLGENIYIEGTISERLYYNLCNSLQFLLNSIMPKLQSVEVYPTNIQSQSQRASGGTTGFSAGIDSFSVLQDHYLEKVPESFKLTHLVYNNLGAHTRGGEDLFRSRYIRLQPIVENEIGLPFIAINSNLNDFFRGLSYQRTHTIRNASVAHLLKNGIGRFLYASSYHYKNIMVGHTQGMAYSDVAILPMLSTDSLDMISVGSQYTRVEKIERIVKIKESYASLDVCINVINEHNCSVCWKCKRTLLTLEIAGHLDCYDKVFDLKIFRKVRWNAMVDLLSSKDPLYCEVVDYAKDKKFKFSASAYLFSYLRLNLIKDRLQSLTRLPGRLKRSIRKRINKIATESNL